MDAGLVQEFILEATDSLRQVETDLLRLEKTADPGTVSRIFRSLHTIKGTAGALKLDSVESLGHLAETLLDLIRRQKRPLTPAAIDALLKSVDALNRMIREPDLGVSADLSPLRKLFDPLITEAPPTPAADTAATETSEVVSPMAPSAMPAGRVAAPPTLHMTRPKPAARVHPPATDDTPARLVRPLHVQEKSASRPPSPLGEREVIGDALSSLTDADSLPSSPGPTVDDDAKMMRVRVRVLDELLQLTSNMIMARNQLLRQFDFSESQAFQTLSHGVTQVHKTVVQTRLQPVGVLFDRVERQARDLCRHLGKDAELVFSGGGLELDRSVVEAFADPLTHLIRNAIDHGIETPDVRSRAGKRRSGTLRLSVREQAGEVLLRLEDDGAGIDPVRLKAAAVERGVVTDAEAAAMSAAAALDLIFRPGFSTKPEAGLVSGRGVGLDVVRTRLAGFGGVVEVQSTPGEGTTFVTRLPLTQALIASSLISALVVTSGDGLYGITQTAVDEIIRLEPGGENLRRLNGGLVYQLRDRMLPLVRLDRLLEPAAGDEVDHLAAPDGGRGWVLVVVRFRGRLFGLLVDSIVRFEEFVARPLPTLIRGCRIFAAHTVMGDGQVALILDPGGIIAAAGFRFAEDVGVTSGLAGVGAPLGPVGPQRLVVFSFADAEFFAIPLELVSVIEKLQVRSIRRVGNREFVQVMGRTLPLLRLDALMEVGSLPPLTEAFLIVPSRVSYPIAVLAGRSVEVVEATTKYEPQLSDGRGLLGTFVQNDRLVILLDIYKLFERHSPERFNLPPVDQSPARLLLAEDSPFFQNLVRSYLEHPPRRITVVSDGQAALDLLRENPDDFDLLVSDIEMPRMDGYELVRQIRADPVLRTLPVIAVTSLAGPEHVQRGLQAGFDSYLVKIDKEQLLATIERYVGRGLEHRAAVRAILAAPPLPADAPPPTFPRGDR